MSRDEPQVRLIVQGRGGLIAALAGGLAVAGLGIWLVIAALPRLLHTPVQPGAAGVETATGGGAATETRRINATLFYVSAEGSELVPVTREVPYAATPAEQARRIAEAQVQPAPEGLSTAIPDGTTIRAVYLTPRGEAYVDVSRELIAGHGGGSLNEALTVYAIVNAMVVNLPDVSAVQILVEGQEIDTLVGHLDLRHPLRRSTLWVQKGQ
jgi:spore germination protein GerM